MLVSAAIDPYKKSYGNAASRSATAAGNSGNERSTASPRKTCVPGVHANAGDGNSAMATMATRAATTRVIAVARTPRGPDVTLYAEAFALTTDRFAEIAELRFHDVGDRLTSGIECVADLLAHRVYRHAIPQLFAALGRPA